MAESLRSAREVEEEDLIGALRQLHEDDPEGGYRVLADDLHDLGYKISERRVWRHKPPDSTKPSADPYDESGGLIPTGIVAARWN